MAKINLDNINKQLSRVSAEYEDTAILSKPMSLSINEIIVNPDNIAAEHDTEESIQDLADSISASGLIHPLTVNHIGEHKYMLLSGERRFKAITTYLHWDSIPCTVYDNLNSDMTTLVTVQANMETREYSVADRLELYKQLDTALRNLKDQGQFKGGVGRAIAKMLGVSERQIGKYKKITQTLSRNDIQKVTNIDKAVEDIKPKKPEVTSGFQELPKQQKTGSDFRFSNSPSEQSKPTEEKSTELDEIKRSLDIAIKEIKKITDKKTINNSDRDNLTTVFDILNILKNKYSKQ